MTELREQQCEACRIDAPKVHPDRFPELLAQIPGWQVIEVDNIKQLHKVYKLAGYPQALALTQQIGELAEANDHHPAILTEWGQVTVTWWSHKIRGLHTNDFIMAAKTDALAAVATA